jgi:hypothetical protein
MTAKEIMKLIDELVRDSCDLCNLKKYPHFGGDPNKRPELIQKNTNNRIKLQVFADKFEQLTENPQ